MKVLSDSWTVLSTLRDKYESQSPRLRSYVVFATAVAIALVASRLDVAMLDALDEMSSKSRFALRLTATGLIEAMEAQFVESVMDNVEERAELLDQQAKSYMYKSKVDRVYAERDRKRGEYFRQFAAHELNLSSVFSQRAAQDEVIRSEILRNISHDEAEREELLNKIDHIHSGLCGNPVLQVFCNMVGAVSDLQREADQETLRLFQEYEAQKNMTRKEYMDNVVALTYAGKAVNYNKTATQLLQAADFWQNKSQEAYLSGVKLNKSAALLHTDVEELKEMEDEEVEWEKKNFSLAEQDWMASELAYRKALRTAVAASFLAVAALILFSHRAILASMNCAAALQKWSDDTKANQKEFWRCISYCCAHGIIFLQGVGVVGNYLLYFHLYQWNERTAIITWFAFVTASIQTTSLHTIPHILAEWPISGKSEWLMITRHFCFRLLSLMLLFALEIIFIWVNFGNRSFSKNACTIFGGPLWFIATFFLLSLHVMIFEPRDNQPVYDEGDRLFMTNVSVKSFPTTITVHTASTPSELTPLTDVGSQASSNISNIIETALRQTHSGMPECGQTLPLLQSGSFCTLTTCSPYYVSFRREIASLMLLLDLLFLSCMIAVLIDCLPLANHFVLVKVGLMCFCFLLTLTVAFVHFSWSRKHRSTTYSLNTKPQYSGMDQETQIEIVSV